MIAVTGAVAAAVPAIAKQKASYDLPAAVDKLLFDHWRWYERLKADHNATKDASIAAYLAGDDTTCGELEEENNAMYSEIYDGPARAIAHATANTLEGCIIQARLLVREYLEEGNWADDCDKHLANSLLAGLERLAGGGS